MLRAITDGRTSCCIAKAYNLTNRKYQVMFFTHSVYGKWSTRSLSLLALHFDHAQLSQDWGHNISLRKTPSNVNKHMHIFDPRGTRPTASAQRGPRSWSWGETISFG
jgi:hypothetical protein